MKNTVRWMVVTTILLASTSAWAAVWNPDADAALKFNMNFQIYNNTTNTTQDAESSITGTLYDFNTVNPNVFGQTSRAGLGVDANFAEIFDYSPGDGVPGPNDAKLVVPNATYGNAGIFDLGLITAKHTWAFWFNVPNVTQGTIIRHQDFYLTAPDDNLWWEIRILGGKLHFRHQNNSLRMETASSLDELGVTANEWHSAAVIIDRTNAYETTVPTKNQSVKMFIDGIEVPILVTSVNEDDMTVDIYWYLYNSPLWIGAGEREFDGLLDDMRLYSRPLTALEVCILNQPDTSVARALQPFPRSTDVVIGTNLTWDPADGVTTQNVYFGTDADNLTQVITGGGSAVESYNPPADLALNTVYYWYVESDSVDGPMFSFTTETGKAINPTPYDGEEDLPTYDVNLMWETPTAATYDVYVSSTRTLVESSDASVRRATGISDHNIIGFDPCSIESDVRGKIFYWKVNSTYPSEGTIQGDIWQFRVRPYELVFNTANYQVSVSDHLVGALACEIHGDVWTGVTTGTLDGNYMNDGNVLAVFNFPSGFDYDRRYDIIVVPDYRGSDIDFNTFPTPLSIRSGADFYFDGRIQIAGDDSYATNSDTIYARSGGFPGPRWNNSISVFSSGSFVVSDYWTLTTISTSTHHRFGSYTSSGHQVCVPTELCKKTFGPGQPVNPPYKGGGGGGNGGRGGDSGRGYFFGIDSAGPSCGDEEVPYPFGGSAGGWGNPYNGAGGAGSIEIIATGNVTLDVNSRINAYGGSQTGGAADYAAGGGAGGSVRIIAGGSVTNKGTINVNGGRGGNSTSTDNSNDTGGGGGGGRVAIFYGTNYDGDDGVITANGGAHGTDSASLALAHNGEDGTILITSDDPNKASAPTPADGDKKVYCSSDPCTIQLKWWSGYGGTTDVVKCDTFNPPTTVRGTVAATRGQHSVSMSVARGSTYYWKVVTDGTVESDTWTFTTVGWQCPIATTNAPHIGGPEWDANHNCVLDIEDFATLAADWLNSGFGQYTIDNVDFNRFAGEYGWCVNRSDGCPGYTNPNP